MKDIIVAQFFLTGNSIYYFSTVNYVPGVMREQSNVFTSVNRCVSTMTDRFADDSFVLLKMTLVHAWTSGPDENI